MWPNSNTKCFDFNRSHNWYNYDYLMRVPDLCYGIDVVITYREKKHSVYICDWCGCVCDAYLRYIQWILRIFFSFSFISFGIMIKHNCECLRWNKHYKCHIWLFLKIHKKWMSPRLELHTRSTLVLGYLHKNTHPLHNVMWFFIRNASISLRFGNKHLTLSTGRQ